MPTYEYRCPDGHEFERFQKMTDPSRAKCPVCGKPGVRQISGGAGLIFKGSGFYITDYGKDGKGPRDQAGEAKTEATPAKAEPASTPAESAPKPAKPDQADKSEKKSSKKKASS